MYDQNFPAQRELATQIMALQDYKNYSQEQRDKILLKRISRFYHSNDHIDVSEEHYRPKLQLPNISDDYIVNDTLILFGVDFLHTSSIRQRFKVNDPDLYLQKIDASNCILHFSSVDYARQAILENFKKDSPTAFKIEQTNPLQFNLSQRQNFQIKKQAIVPKQWIQLQPYIYRHYYRSQKLCPHMYDDYSRKLFIRYASFHQRSAVKVSFEVIQQLYRKCEQVWRVEGQRNKQLKKVLYLKLKEFKQRKDILQRKLKQCQIIDGIIQNSNIHSIERSRSRRSHFSKHNPKIFDQQHNKKHSQRKSKQGNKIDMQNQLEKNEKQMKSSQKHRNQILEFSQLINGIKGVTLRLENASNYKQPEENRQQVSELCNQLNNLNFSKMKAQYIPIPSRLAKPNQLRLNNCRKSRFKYHEYVKKNEEIQNKVLKFTQVDLTLQ